MIKKFNISHLFFLFLIACTPCAYSRSSEINKNKMVTITLSEFFEHQLYKRAFGTWSIEEELFDFIRNLLPNGKTILEFGSGWASGELSKHYIVYSIEHDRNWLNKYNTNYIYAPIINNWYNPQAIVAKLAKEYDLILVDGPTGNIGRYGFYSHLVLFNLNIPLIFDDVNRQAEMKLLEDVAEKLDRPYHIFLCKNKEFGVIFP